jgi:two-component sensor histidine kinase
LRTNQMDTIISGKSIVFAAKDKKNNLWFNSNANGIFKLDMQHSIIQILHKMEKEYKYLFTNANTLYACKNDGSVYIIEEHKAKLVIPSCIAKNDLTVISNFIYKNNILLINQFNKIYIYSLESKIPKLKNVMQDKIKGLIIRVEPLQNELLLQFVNTFVVKTIDASFKKTNDTAYQLFNNKSNQITSDGKQFLMATRDGVYTLKNQAMQRLSALDKLIIFKFKVVNNRLIAIDENADLICIKHYLSNQPIIQRVHLPNVSFDQLRYANDTMCIATSNEHCYAIRIRDTIQVNKDIFPLSLNAKMNEIKCATMDETSLYLCRETDIIKIPASNLCRPQQLDLPKLKSIRLNNELYSDANMNFAYNQFQNFTFSFTNYLSDYQKVVYEYKMSDNNQTDDWLKMNGQELSFINPSYGDYTILVRCKNQLNQVSPVYQFNFTIQKPFWAKWWFIILCSLLFLGCSWLVYQYLLNIKLKRKKIQYDTDLLIRKSEFKSLNALINPHFVFNSLNNIQGLINQNSKQNANRYLSIFAKIMRQNMYNVDKGVVSLKTELDLVKNYVQMEKLRHEDFFEFEIEMDEEIDDEAIILPPLTLQPIVENAINHGLLERKGMDCFLKISILENEHNQSVQIVIEDNGIGYPETQTEKSEDRKSIGLANITKRFEQMKDLYDIEMHIAIQSKKNSQQAFEGTRVVVSISK